MKVFKSQVARLICITCFWDSLFFQQKRLCIELNENILDPEYERAFKKITEEFDSVGHQWLVREGRVSGW